MFSNIIDLPYVVLLTDLIHIVGKNYDTNKYFFFPISASAKVCS